MRKIGLFLLVCLFSVSFVGCEKDSSSNEKNDINKEKSIKIDDSKNYVYDANYKYDGQQFTEYKRYDDDSRDEIDDILKFILKTSFNNLSDLKAPYINIKSDDTTKVNDEIKNIYLEKLKLFDKCALENKEKTDFPSCSIMFDYRNFESKDIISIVVGTSTQSTSVPFTTYYTYNFDKKTGKLLKYDEVLSKLGYTKDSVLEKVKSSIKGRMNEKLTFISDLTTGCPNSNSYSEKPNCYEISYAIYNNSVSENKLSFFVNNEGNLGIITPLYFEGQNGTSNKTVIVK